MPNVRCRRGQCPRFVIRRRCQCSPLTPASSFLHHMAGSAARLRCPAQWRCSTSTRAGQKIVRTGQRIVRTGQKDGQGRSPRRRPDRIDRPADADVADARVARPDRSRSRTLMINACGPLWLPRDLKGPDTLIHRGFPGTAQSVGAIRWLGGSVWWCRSHGVHQARSPSGTVSHALPAGVSRSAASTLR